METKPNLDRREFLRRSLLGVGLASTAPLFLNRAILAMASQDGGDPGRILLVLQLSGGNDGLSTVVPFAMDEYRKARPTLALDAKDLHKLDDVVALHHALTGLKGLFDEGKLAVLQGIGYPNPNRSHFKSMDIWHSADASALDLRYGWLGRAVDACCERATQDPTFAVSLGQRAPLALNGKSYKPVAFADPNAYRWNGGKEEEKAFDRTNKEKASAEGVMEFLGRTSVDAMASSEKVRAAASSYKTPVQYPQGGLARDLRNVAALMAARLPTRVFYTQFGNFDTHVQQRQRHDQLMRELDGALTAFVKDVRRLGLEDRVLVMTFSEFGRRVAENGSRGTDHGTAAPMFVLGSGVKGGIYGKHPSLTDLDKGDLRFGTDFRRAYATVLAKWMGVDPRKVLKSEHEPMEFLRGA